MARGFSKAIIIGNVTRDPEMRTTSGGSQVCSFSVAVNRSYKDSSGTLQESVSFINCSAWGRTGEIIAQYTKKGSGIMVCGRLNQRTWEDNDGKKRSDVEIVVEDFNFVGGGAGPDEAGAPTRSSGRGSKKASAPAEDDMPGDMMSDEPIDLGDIPF